MSARVLIGERIRARRAALGLNVREAAARCGMSFQTFSGIENGVNTTVDTLDRIAAALGDELILDLATEQDPLVAALYRALPYLDVRTREILQLQIDALAARGRDLQRPVAQGA